MSWWWGKYSTAGRYAVRGAVGGCGGESGSYAVRGAASVYVGGVRLVQRDGGAFAVAAVVLLCCMWLACSRLGRSLEAG